MIFYVVTLTLKVDLLYKKNASWTMTFESMGLLILHMVAAGELCCLSDNSGLKSGSTPSHHHHHQVRTPSHQTALWIRHCWRMPVTSAFFHFGLKSLRPFTMSAFCKFGLPSWHFGLQYWLFGPFRLYTGSKDRAHFVFSSPGRMSGELLSYPRRRRWRWRARARAQKL